MPWYIQPEQKQILYKKEEKKKQEQKLKQQQNYQY